MSQVEMLSDNCTEWSTDRPYILCPTVTIVKWCHTVMQTVHQHQEVGRSTNTKKKGTSMADHSCRISQRLNVVNYFGRNAAPQMFFCTLNMTLYLIWLTYQKTCVSTKRLYKQKTTITTTATYLPNTTCLSNQFC